MLAGYDFAAHLPSTDSSAQKKALLDNDFIDLHLLFA
jgi:hypothetical protein